MAKRKTKFILFNVAHIKWMKWKKTQRFGWIVQALRSSIITNTTHNARHRHAFVVVVVVVLQASPAEENFTLSFSLSSSASPSSTFHFFSTLAVALRTEPTLHISFPCCTNALLRIRLFVSHRIYFVSPKENAIDATTNRKRRRNNKKVTAIELGSYAARCSSVHLQQRRNTDYKNSKSTKQKLKVLQRRPNQTAQHCTKPLSLCAHRTIQNCSFDFFDIDSCVDLARVNIFWPRVISPLVQCRQLSSTISFPAAQPHRQCRWCFRAFRVKNVKNRRIFGNKQSNETRTEWKSSEVSVSVGVCALYFMVLRPVFVTV